PAAFRAARGWCVPLRVLGSRRDRRIRRAAGQEAGRGGLSRGWLEQRERSTAAAPRLARLSEARAGQAAPVAGAVPSLLLLWHGGTGQGVLPRRPSRSVRHPRGGGVIAAGSPARRRGLLPARGAPGQLRGAARAGQKDGLAREPA